MIPKAGNGSDPETHQSTGHTPPIVVIGASAGGVEALTRIVRALPADMPAAIFVTMHFPSFGTSVLPRILARAGVLPADHAHDKSRIEPGRIYVAPPDRHLIVLREHIRVVRGPRENGNRPAIDPMFRSASLSHGARTVGVILTGNLDDGTAGLLSIKRRGGLAIVQDPEDALFPSMPTSAVAHVDVDELVPVDRIASAIVDAVRAAASHTMTVVREGGREMTDQERREVGYAELDMVVIEEAEQHPGALSQFACPDCGGVLWEIIDEKLVRYRCRVGHAWTSEGLMAQQSEQLETALWMALRALEESASLNESMAARARKRGNENLATKYDRDARAAMQRAHAIRDVLIASGSRDRSASVPSVPAQIAQT